MSDLQDIYFRGDIAPGCRMAAVKQRLSEMFKLDATQAQKLFSGRPVVIRRGLDSAAAQQYQAALFKAGALVELRPAAGEPADNTAKVDAPAKNHVPAHQTADTKPTPQSEPATELGLAPAGSDVLAPDERETVVAVEVDTSALSLDNPGVDLLNASERKAIPKVDIDTSHLQIEEMGT